MLKYSAWHAGGLEPWQQYSRQELPGSMCCSTPRPQAAAQVLDAREKLHLDVACAIWEVMREYEDRCDMELEDVGCSHVVWQLANAAIAAQQGTDAS